MILNDLIGGIDLARWPTLRERHRTPASIALLPGVEVYVDESGDRGFSARSTTWFAMGAVMVPDESVPHVRTVIGGLRYEVGTTKPLHWVDHFPAKRASRRELASRLVAEIPGVKVIYVIAHKPTMQASEALRADCNLFYHYVMRLLIERVAFEVKCWTGGPRVARVRLGAVRNMDHDESQRYLDLARSKRNTIQVPWSHVHWPPKWYGTNQYDGIQLADVYIGMFRCAIEGQAAPYLLAHRHQLRRSPRGAVLGYGIKVYGDRRFITDRPWWGQLSAG